MTQIFVRRNEWMAEIVWITKWNTSIVDSLNNLIIEQCQICVIHVFQSNITKCCRVLSSYEMFDKTF